MTRLLPLLLAVLAACGGPASPASEPSTYPPDDLARLRAIFEPRLAPLGVTLVRGGVVQRTATGHSPSPTGNHLALYVEATGDYPAGRFVRGLIDVTKVFAPEVFERWPALDSFDVCQEPLPGDDDRREPPPVTQVTLTRAAADAIDWSAFDLEDLLRLTLEPDAEPGDPTTRPALVLAGDIVTKHPAYRAAAKRAFATRETP